MILERFGINLKKENKFAQLKNVFSFVSIPKRIEEGSQEKEQQQKQKKVQQNDLTLNMRK